MKGEFKMKTKLMTTSIIALLLGLYPPCIASSWQVIYQTDFSSDPYWMTSRPTHYFWDPSDTTYYIDQENINYGGNYAVIETGYAGGSFRLQYDIQILSTNYAGGVSFGLYDPDLNSNNTGGYAEVHFVNEDCGNVVFLETKNKYDNHGGTVSISPQFVIGTWYRVLMEYDEGNKTLMVFITNRDNSATHAYMSISGVGPFASDMGLLGNSNIRDYTFQVLGAHCTAKIDNVTLSVAQGDTNEYEYSDYTWYEHNGHLYAITLKHSNWAQAEAWAKKVGGHLVQIDDVAELEWLSSTFKGHYAQSDPGNPWSSYVWIGLEYVGGDMRDRLSWQWSTGQLLTFDPPWWINPNNYKGIHVYLHTDTHPNPGTWLNYEVQDINPEAYPKGIIEIDEPECQDPHPYEPFSFAQISDTHMGYDNSREKLVAIINKLKNENIDFVVVTGDISDTGCPGNCYLDDPSSPEWCGTKCPGSYADFKVVMSRLYFDKGIITYTIPGNHDRRYYNPAYANVSPNDLLCYSWLLESSQGITALTHRDEFNHKGIKFVTLDTGDGNCSGSLIDDDIDFLKDLNPCIPKIILTHHPAVANPNDGGWQSDLGCEQVCIDDNNDNFDGHEDFIKYCENLANNVYMVLSGHTHNNKVYDKNRGIPTGYPLYIQTGSTLDGFARIISFASATSPPTVQLIQLAKEDYNYEAAKLLSPGNLHAYDSVGRHTGYDPGNGSEHGIPQSVYFSHYVNETEEGSMVSPEEVMICDPTDDYLWEVIGNEKATYDLEITSVTLGVETTFKAIDIPTSPGARHVYVVDWEALATGEDGVTLEIDSDGDGIFEKTVIADKYLTSQEFALQTKTVIDIKPDTLNLRNLGKLVTVYIELPEGFDVSNTDVSTLNLNDTVYALSKPVAVGDYDSDGIPDLMVKFDRQQVIGALASRTEMVTLTGCLSDGRLLAGIDFIRIIDGESIESTGLEVDLITPERFTADMKETGQTTDNDSIGNSGEDEFDIEQAVAFMLYEATEIVDEFGTENFDNEESTFKLSYSLDEVFKMLDEGMYIESLSLLENYILQRMDGCANIGHPDEDDWIMSIEGQALLYPRVVEAIELLESML